MYETIKLPCIVGETKDGRKLYVKTFLWKSSNKLKCILSVVINKKGLHISVSTHEERIEQIVKK